MYTDVHGALFLYKCAHAAMPLPFLLCAGAVVQILREEKKMFQESYRTLDFDPKTIFSVLCLPN
jgi:hypothetical protein